MSHDADLNLLLLALHLGRANPLINRRQIAARVLEFRKLGRRIASLTVTECNEPMTKRQDAMLKSAHVKLHELAKTYGAKLDTSCYIPVLKFDNERFPLE